MVTNDFPQMRRNMIDSQLRTSGVNAAWILAAMGSVEREKFVSADRAAVAYMDRPVSLGGRRTLNPPLAAGLLLQTADLRADDTVLLVGAATGYLASLIAGQVSMITAVEENGELLDVATKALSAYPNVRFEHGPLLAGSATNAPYSVIVIDGAVDAVPQGLIDQLAEGGRLVCGLSDGAVKRIASGYKRSGSLALRTIADCEIAPIPGFERAKEFVF
jgi:protein-L-isoaspartate(D-aspartate) O-methyltransferase